MSRQYESMNNTAPIYNPVFQPKHRQKQSGFNLSKSMTFNAHFGLCMPVHVMTTIPGDEFDIAYNISVQVSNPTVRKLMSAARIFTHSFYMNLHDLWRGAASSLTRGRSGNIDLPFPTVSTEIIPSDQQAKKYSTFTPMSIADYMGIPFHYFKKNEDPIAGFRPIETTGSDANRVQFSKPLASGYNALPFAMYNRAWRDYYANQNLLMTNKFWLPDDEDSFIMDYNTTVASTNYGAPPQGSQQPTEEQIKNLDSALYVPGQTLDELLPPVLGVMHYRQFRGDLFTSASPFPDIIRGTAPYLESAFTSSGLDFSKVMAEPAERVQSSDVFLGFIDDTVEPKFRGGLINGTATMAGDNGLITYNSEARDKIVAALNRAQLSGSVVLNITQNTLRSLKAYTKFMERNARTSGSYNDMVESHYGFSPGYHDRKPIFIGTGSYQDIVFSEVVNQSDSETAPLGMQAGRGYSDAYGKVGRFRAPDYGIIMTIVSIVPETIYTQGVPRIFTRLSQKEQYFPELNELPAEPLLNRDLFVSGDADVDNDVFGYVERFAEMKTAQNTAHGYFRLDSSANGSAEYSSRIFARRFTKTPNLNASFVTCSPGNIDMSPFSATTEPPFVMTVEARIGQISCKPFVAVPGEGA